MAYRLPEYLKVLLVELAGNSTKAGCLNSLLLSPAPCAAAKVDCKLLNTKMQRQRLLLHLCAGLLMI